MAKKRAAIERRLRQRHAEGGSHPSPSIPDSTSFTHQSPSPHLPSPAIPLRNCAHEAFALRVAGGENATLAYSIV